jgi:hypothetical protein
MILYEGAGEGKKYIAESVELNAIGNWIEYLFIWKD